MIVETILNKFFALLILFLIWPVLILIMIFILLDDGLPIVHSQNRIGLNGKTFKFYKFRTMKTSTPQIATHLMKNPSQYHTRVGPFLRRLSLDEFPQILNILKGEMVFVGPRPALFNQYDLNAMREQAGIHKLIPGITGWAQVNGRDSISLEEKVKLEKHYLNNKSSLFDFKILLLTLKNVIFSKNVIH